MAKTTLITRRRFVKSISKARGIQNKAYRALVANWLPRFDRCASCRQYRCLDVHHTCGRVGRLLLETDYWLPLCRQCHDFVKLSPDTARLKGLLCPMGNYNGPRRDSQPMLAFAEQLDILRSAVARNAE